MYGPVLAGELQDGSRRLATLLGLPLLQVAFVLSVRGEWRFLHATGFVDWQLGGHALARALVRALLPGEAS